MEGSTNANWVKLISTINQLYEQGGPNEDQYDILNPLLEQLSADIATGFVSTKAIEKLREHFKAALSEKTIQGRGLMKQFGYSGDFLIIEDIYKFRMSDDPSLKKWDAFFHAQSAPKAVRNRKAYFINLIEELHRKNNQPLNILNIASGPCRDLREFFDQNPNALIHFDCVDVDPFAIEHAKNVCRDYLDRISFFHNNAFKFTTDKQYDLIWSAGLFDYFDDDGFIILLNRLKEFAKQNTEIIIGNFSKDNPSRAYMELVGDWYLHYRDPEELVMLAHKAGFPPNQVYVEAEAEGVNLFLRMKN